MADGYISQIKTPDNKVYLLKDSEKTDEKVKQTSNTEDKEFPIILKNTNNTTNETNGVKYDGEVTVNPNQSRITATTIKANSRLVASKAISQIITGTGTAGSYTNSTYYPAKWTFNTGLTATDGDIFTIKIPIAGHDYGVFMSVDNGSHYYPVVLNGTGRITTHYPVNTYLTVIFEPTGSATSMYAVAGQTSSTRITVTGGVWRVLNYYDSNSNDTGYYHRRIYPNLKAGGAIHPYSIIMQLPNGKWSGITTTAPNNPGKSNVSPVATGKTANTSGFMLGHVLLMYANTTYTDTNNIGTYNIWSAHTGLIDARYSFNLANSTGNGFVAYTPVYIVGTVSDGLFHLDTTKWWTQTLPSSDDGKVYIYIGDAYDWYRLTFTEDKPIYWYKDGAVRLYSGASEYALNAATVNGLTVKTAVPANAIFTDHYDWDDITNKPTTLSGYGITDAASSGHSHTLKIGNKSLSVSTSEQEWTVHDILKTSINIGTDTSWDQTTPGAYYVASSGAFTGTGHPGTNQEAPYSYGGLYVLRAGNGGAAQFYISDAASGGTNKAYGIRYRSGWNVINNTAESHWRGWATILDDKNFNLYAPTLTGVGASGSWGISITGNADTTTAANLTSTANAVAYYTNTTGTFGSKASANGALYATSANGALQWGTLPIAQGGTGVVSFTKNQVILSDNTNGTTGLTSRAYSDSSSAGALSNTSTNFVTERDVYFGLPTLNNAHNYASSSTYYAPTTGGTAGHVLIGAGATTAPAWYGGTVMSGTAAASWITAFNGTTDATATNAAAVTIAGGLGVAKKLRVGDTATVPDLTIGSTNEYGDAYTPIYWHEGVPTVVTLTQQCAFTIKSGMSGVRLSHAAITANSYVTQIVVTSGESKLNSAISWTSASGYIELTCSSTVSGDVTGYIMISRGGEITATATDIT